MSHARVNALGHFRSAVAQPSLRCTQLRLQTHHLVASKRQLSLRSLSSPRFRKFVVSRSGNHSMLTRINTQSLEPGNLTPQSLALLLVPLLQPCEILQQSLHLAGHQSCSTVQPIAYSLKFPLRSSSLSPQSLALLLELRFRMQRTPLPAHSRSLRAMDSVRSSTSNRDPRVTLFCTQRQLHEIGARINASTSTLNSDVQMSNSNLRIQTRDLNLVINAAYTKNVFRVSKPSLSFIQQLP
jgi:hypothetical protein